MKNKTRFRSYNPDQQFLLPPSMRDWLDEDDLVYFILDVVKELDLEPIYRAYDGSKGGQPPYNPTMMTALLIYAYCVGIPSSRKIERATCHQIPFRVLTADQQPDHDTIAAFRQRHLKPLASLFVDVLQLCQRAGLVKLGHVSIDGTKVRANASKHKAMSYGRMVKKEKELEDEVAALLSKAQSVDDEEDTKYGKGKRGDELPEELRFRKSRLKKIRKAKKELEQEALEKANKRREEIRRQEETLAKEGKKRKGRKPEDPSDKPNDKSQRNFTDPDSRIMKDGATKSFEQSYNCQAAVDGHSQVIVADNVTQEANDKKQVEPVIEILKENTGGEKPVKVSCDSGYFSESNVNYFTDEKIDSYIATGKQKHGEKPPPSPHGRIPNGTTVKDRMSRKLRTKKGSETYSKRKEIVEPVFGQIKEARGFRRFLLRGLENVKGEWCLICLTHNLLKLFRSGMLSKSLS